jgi:hypothetical protein
MQEIDTEAPATMNKNAFEHVAEVAAETLLLASKHIGGDEFVTSQANQAMKDLIALDGWVNRLGPRYLL